MYWVQSTTGNWDLISVPRGWKLEPINLWLKTMQGQFRNPQTALTFRELKWPCHGIWNRVNSKSSFGSSPLFTTPKSKYLQYSAALNKCHRRDDRARRFLRTAGRAETETPGMKGVAVHWWGRERHLVKEKGCVRVWIPKGSGTLRTWRQSESKAWRSAVRSGHGCPWARC